MQYSSVKSFHEKLIFIGERGMYIFKETAKNDFKSTHICIVYSQSCSILFATVGIRQIHILGGKSWSANNE